MKERTLKIIAVCKGNTRYNTTDDLQKDVINYLCDECGCNPNDYTSGVLESIVEEALLDYVDASEHSGGILKLLLDKLRQPGATFIMSVLVSLKLQKVCNSDGTFCNGFGPEFLNVVEELA